MQADILIENGLIITLDDERRIIKDGAIAVAGDKIAALGKTAELKKEYSAKKVINARDKVVAPGFVDCHVHVTQHMGKGFVPDDVAAVPWIFDWQLKIYPHMDSDDQYTSALLAFTEMIKTGTTCFCEAFTAYEPECLAKAMEETGIRGVIGRHTWDIPSEPKQTRATTEQALESLERVITEYHGRAQGRINAWAHLIGIGTATDALLQGAKRLADKYRVGLAMHQSVTPDEVEEYARQRGKRPIEHFQELGILDRNLLLVHMLDVSDKEVELLGAHSVNIAHCPTSALRLAYGATKIGRFPEMMEAGANVCLGCDGANCSNHLDMGRCVYLAAGIFKDCRMDINQIPAELALEMGTINGARALLLEDEIGSLQPGKKADLVLYDRLRPEWVPLLHPVRSLVYSADGKSVDTVIIDGQLVMEEGRLTRLDEQALYREAQERAEKLMRRTGLELRSRWKTI